MATERYNHYSYASNEFLDSTGLNLLAPFGFPLDSFTVTHVGAIFE